MSKLEELIQQYHPRGVEYIKLGDYFVQLNGMTGVSNKWADEGNCVFIDYMNAYKNIKTDVTALNFATVKCAKQTTLRKGDVLFTSASETPDECALASEIEDDIQDDIFMDDHLFGLRLKDEYSDLYTQGFLKYVFRSDSFRRIINKAVRGVTRFYISKTDFMKLEVPLPALPVQREIVRILDEFSLLSAELAAELAARKQQYEYYRDRIILSNNSPLIKLGDVASITRGGNFQKKDFLNNLDEGKPCIHYGQMYTHFGVHTDKVLKNISEDAWNKSKKAVKNDIVMAVTSENVEDVCSCVAWLGDDDIAISGHTAIIHHNQNAKYLSYYFRTSHFFAQKRRLAHGTKVIEVTPDRLNDILVPLPSIEEQNKIVEVLDRFNELTEDIASGLPAEIEARQKQYEYYRDKLLSFKRKEIN